MKKIAGVSLFIFFCVVTAVLTAGLVFYEKKNNPSVAGLSNTNVNNTSTNVKKPNSNTGVNTNTSTSNTASGSKILDTAEVAKHNKNSDCWIIVNNKIYDISNYASSHPGGSRNITSYCGKESTRAFDTKGGWNGPHSTSANQMLDQFYVGDLNQKISQANIDQTVQKIQAKPITTTTGGDFEDDD